MTTLTILTDEQLDAIWRRAGQAQDMTMVDFVERALDGDEFSRRLVSMSARDVAIYAAVVAQRSGAEVVHGDR